MKAHLKAFPKVRPQRHDRSVPEAKGVLTRTCMGCLQARPKSQLLRLVCSPTGHLVLDAYGKLAGRGIYLCAQRSCAEHAMQGARLQATFGQAVACGPVDELLPAMALVMEQRLLACIRMARKAGRAVSGYTRVSRALRYGTMACLLVAEDTAGERRGQYQDWCAQRQIPCRSFLTKARLGALVGRHSSSAIGILDRGLGERLLACLEGMSQLTERNGKEVAAWG